MLFSCLGFAAAIAAQTAPQPAAQQPSFTLKKVGEGVYAAINPDGGRSGSNAGFIVGDNAVLVVDALVRPDVARDLLAEIRKITNLPIRYLVNTHYHLDHTGGDAVFQEAGAVLMANSNVHKWLHTENLKFFGATATPEQKARVDALPLPQLTWEEGIEIWLGSRRVIVHSFPGHTGGDSAVFVPDANVVFGGDLIWNQHLPNTIDATTDKWINTLDLAVQHHPEAVFIPGHGDVATVANVRDFRNYLADLRKAVGDARATGKSGDDLTNTVTQQIKAKYGTWGFLQFLPRNIEQMNAELAGTKKVPQP